MSPLLFQVFKSTRRHPEFLSLSSPSSLVNFKNVTLLFFIYCMLMMIVMAAPTFAHLDDDGLADVRCRKISTQTECRETSGCAFDSLETKRCWGIHGKSCEFFHTKSSCETNYGCRWAFGFENNRWRPSCKPFEFQLPAKRALVYPGRDGPKSCASIQGRKECLAFSGCQPNKEFGCRPQKLIFRQSFYFVDGCTQNYDLTQCKNQSALPYRGVFLERIDSSWYFIDRVEVLTRVTQHPNHTFTSDDSFAKVYVWYAHDQVQGRSFVYDLKLDDTEDKGYSVFKYEAYQGRTICRPSPPGSGPIATIETILRTSPRQIIPQFGTSLPDPGVGADQTTSEFSVETGNSSQSATAVGTGPKYLIFSVTSDIIADVAGRLISEHSDANCESEEEFEKAFVPAILKREDIGLGDESSSSSSSLIKARIADPCVLACMEIKEATQRLPCIHKCTGQVVEANIKATRPLPAVLEPNGLVWKTNLTLGSQLDKRFDDLAVDRIEQVRRLFAEFCRGKKLLPNLAEFITQTEALVENLERLETETLLPLDVNLGKAYTIISLLRQINKFVSDLESFLNDVAFELQRDSQIPALETMIRPIYKYFNETQTKLVDPVKSKLSAVGNDLEKVRGPLLAFLEFNEESRQEVLYASGGTETFVVRPVKIARCSKHVDAITKEILDSGVVSRSNNFTKNAISGLKFARDVTQQVGNVIRNVDIPGLQALLLQVHVVYSFWINTLFDIISPLFDILETRIKLLLPSLCVRHVETCVIVPCGIETCTKPVWCETVCNEAGICHSTYCTSDTPCRAKFCEKCLDVKIWVPCIKSVSYTVRQLLSGAPNLLGGSLDAVNEAFRPLLDTIPKFPTDVPALPPTNAIPPNIQAIVNHVNVNVTTQLLHAEAEFIVEQIPDEIMCGYGAYVTGQEPVTFWECQPWKHLLYDGLVVPIGPFSISLTWFEQGALDLIVQTPNGKVISWLRPGPSLATDFGAIDYDDQFGLGPESVFWSLEQPPRGLYYVCIQPSDPVLHPDLQEFRLTMRQNGDIVSVFESFLDFDSEKPISTSECNPDIRYYVDSVQFPHVPFPPFE